MRIDLKAVPPFINGETVRIKFMDKYAGGLTLPMAHDMLKSKMRGRISGFFSQGNKQYAHVRVGLRTWMFDVNALIKVRG